MDQNPLVNEHRDSGEAIASRCAAAGIDVTAAFWVKPSEDGRWYLYLASREVEDRGLGEAFRRVLAEIRRMTPPPQLDTLGDLKLIGATNPITRDVLAIQTRYPTPLSTWYRGRQLGNMAIDEAYLYRPRQSPARQA
jgi:hypothetical protein